MRPLHSLARCLRCAVEALRAPAPPAPPTANGARPGPPALPPTPRPVKWLWAAALTGAVVAELAATSTGPVAELLRGFLFAAGAPVRDRGSGDGPAAGCVCSTDPPQLGPAAVEGGTSGGPPADERIPRPAPRP